MVFLWLLWLFLYNHEQVMSLIEIKMNDEVWTETLVLEEADRVQRPGPADPPVKITTIGQVFYLTRGRNNLKINKLQKKVCIY